MLVGTQMDLASASQSLLTPAAPSTRWQRGHPAHCNCNVAAAAPALQERQAAARRLNSSRASHICRGAPGNAALHPPSQQGSACQRAAVFTGAYAVVGGLALLAAPKATFGLLFDALAVPSGWIRVGGALFALIGLQYLGTGLMHGQQGGAPMAFYRSTVWSRLFLVAAFVALVGTWQVQPSLLVLAALNLAGAVSMALAIRRDLSTTGAP